MQRQQRQQLGLFFLITIPSHKSCRFEAVWPQALLFVKPET
jgi:hypothetical protein